MVELGTLWASREDSEGIFPCDSGKVLENKERCHRSSSLAVELGYLVGHGGQLTEYMGQSPLSGSSPKVTTQPFHALLASGWD